ncbi:MAG: IclR family transcriptional regulator [Candidatus Competibacterales bacterium]|nr:IclR family transcriptional regulator [Candidatus Competibacterales bacterium]
MDRAIKVLYCVAESDRPIGLTDICRFVGLDKATAVRLLNTLEQADLIAREPKSRRYRLGLGAYRLQRPARHDLHSISRPWLEALRESTQETVSLVCPRGLERVVVDVLPAPQEFGVWPAVGTAHPIYSGASGKVLMAFMAEDERERIIQQTRLEPISPRAISDQDTYRKAIRQAQAQGYAWSVGDVNDGAAALAAPVFDASGTVVAVVAVRGPEARLSPTRMQELGPEVAQTGIEISRELGYRPEHKVT